MWTAPLNVVRFDATTLWHFDAAERAPSTKSKATELQCLSNVRSYANSDRVGYPAGRSNVAQGQTYGWRPT
jgi:hypothetical protein